MGIFHDVLKAHAHHINWLNKIGQMLLHTGSTALHIIFVQRLDDTPDYSFLIFFFLAEVRFHRRIMSVNS